MSPPVAVQPEVKTLKLSQTLGQHDFSSKLVFYLNGRRQEVTNPDPCGTLLDYIRSTGLTGTKLGCSEGGCGACTVDVASFDKVQNRVVHSALNACIVPLIAIEGKHLITVEGIGNTQNPHPAQERIALFHGSQCGFCTPGIVMSLYALLRNNAHPSEEEIAESFDGNLCRCTGYKPIIDAANTFSCGRAGGCCRDREGTKGGGCQSGGGDKAEDTSQDKEIDMNQLFTPNGVEYKPYKPDTELIFPPKLVNYELGPLYYGNEKKVWFRPVTKQQLLEIKHTYPDAKLVGGASEIQIEIKMKAADYNVSVFANDVDELKTYKYYPGKGLEFGANISLTTLEHVVKELAEMGPQGQIYACMAEQLKYFAGRQIRNAATPAGNVATASPISDLNPVLVCAEAVLTVESVSDGVQEISMADFFVGYRKTKLPPHAIITKIFVPDTAQNEVVRSYKQSKRKDDDIAIVTTCLRICLDDESKISKARLVYGGVGPFTVAAKKTGELLEGKLLNSETQSKVLEEALDSLAREYDMPYSVPGGMASYRRTLVTSFFYKFYQELLEYFKFDGVDHDAFVEVTRKTRPTGTRNLKNPYEESVVGKSYPHTNSMKQVTGEATYTDDILPLHGEVFAVQVMSTRARAKILSVDTSEALDMLGVVGYCDANDLPSREANWWSPTPSGAEPFFAEDEVFFAGQCIGVIVAEDREIAAAAARAVKVEYEDLDAVVTIEQAMDKESFFDYQPRCVKGDVEKEFVGSEYVFEGTTRLGSQEHFYLETQGCVAIYEEDGEMKLYTSSQNLQESQAFCAQVLGLPHSRVVAKTKRLGGGFGGKESRCCQLSSLAAVASKRFKRPVRMILSRSEDMLTSGQRHPFVMKWKVGLDKNYKFTALKAQLYANAGWTMDLTKGVIERAVLHSENCYDFPSADIKAFPCKTNVASNTAFRGFGGPQGMFMAESYIVEIAEQLNIDPDTLREINYLVPNVSTTPYRQQITEDFTVPQMAKEVKEQMNYDQLRKEVEVFNKEHKWIKRGLAHVPTKFGVSFGAAFLNRAGALVQIYHDGSVLVAHGGVEMGQGLYTKCLQVAAEELGVSLDDVFTSETATNTVANAAPTAASAGSDLNCMAIKNACDQLNERLKPFRESLGPKATMHEIAHAAFFARTHLAATGWYATPDIGYIWRDHDPLMLSPDHPDQPSNNEVKPAFFYYTQGCAASLVEVNTLTGDWSCLRTDIKMDIGRPINQAIDYGQIEGGYVQGQGLFTIEESLWMQNGSIFTRGPGAYKIPGFRDIPQEFNVSHLMDREFDHLKTIKRSKGVGEPPLFLGSVVYFAIRDALKYSREVYSKGLIKGLPAPLTTERIRNYAGDPLADRGNIEPTEGDNKSFFLYA